MISNLNKNLHYLLVAVLLAWHAPAFAQAPVDDAAEEPTVPAVETNPAVRAALETPRETPGDYFQAIVWLIDLGRPELAKPILDQLTKLPLDDAQRAALVAKFGSRDMLRLARAKELAPAGAQFADAAIAAAAAAANDPQRVAALIARLNDPSPAGRAFAQSDLAAIGEPAAVALLEALAQEKVAQRRDILVEAIMRIGPDATGPLIGSLIQQRNRSEFGADVIRILQAMQVAQAVPLLAAYTQSPDAERLLVDSINRYRRGTPAFVADENDEVTLWLWCKGHLEQGRHSADEAQSNWLARLALELANLRPDVREYQKQALALAFEAGFGAPNSAGTSGICDLAEGDAQRIVKTADVALFDEVLADALNADYARAAVAAIDALAARGDARLLYRADSQPSPLANALGHADRRVRFAALRAIMALDPTSPYAGSSRVPDAIVWFAGSTGDRRALVAMPTLFASTNLAGMLASHDLDAEATNRGRDAVNWARETADLEMIFLDMNILDPTIRQVVYELRLIAETRNVPIALLAAEGRLADAQRLAAEHERVVAVPRPHSDAVLANIVERLATAAGRNPVSPEERAAQAESAAKWLDQLSAGRPFYTIRRPGQFNIIESGRDAPSPAADPR